MLDYPSDRSLHARPISRAGGIAILAGSCLGGVLTNLYSSQPAGVNAIVLLLGMTPLAVISCFDDRYTVAIKWRLLGHGWAAVTVVLTDPLSILINVSGLALTFSTWASIFLQILFSMWIINLYNFMDGMDGFASGMAVIGFATLACMGRIDSGFATYCMIVAAASAGFLVHNFPPAKIFMGDTGSTALGFLVAACSLWGSKTGLFPLWAAILIFSPFIVDATVTLLRRLLRGEKVWQAHRTHYYQRLVLLGWGHRRTVLTEYVLMLACSGSAVLAVHLSSAGQAGLIVAWLFVYSFLMWGVGWLERRHATVANL